MKGWLFIEVISFSLVLLFDLLRGPFGFIGENKINTRYKLKRPKESNGLRQFITINSTVSENGKEASEPTSKESRFNDSNSVIKLLG